VLSIAGLWDQWKDPEAISSATLIVTDANDFSRQIHDRMPVLLGRQDRDVWLTGKAGAELMRPAPNDLLRMCRYRSASTWLARVFYDFNSKPGLNGRGHNREWF
jgi:putative SOS response-associated peptidase YedK